MGNCSKRVVVILFKRNQNAQNESKREKVYWLNSEKETKNRKRNTFIHIHQTKTCSLLPALLRFGWANTPASCLTRQNLYTIQVFSSYAVSKFCKQVNKTERKRERRNQQHQKRNEKKNYMFNYSNINEFMVEINHFIALFICWIYVTYFHLAER